MHDDLDLRVIERRHEADPRYRAELRRHLATILEGREASPADDALTIDLQAPAPTPIEHRRWWLLGTAALIGAAAAVAGIVVATTGDDTPAPANNPVPVAPSTVPATTGRPTSGGMWPQSTLGEVRAAQQLADAGDPAATWQVNRQLSPDDPSAPVEVELVDRFIHEVLGWEAYRFNGGEGGDGDGWEDGDLEDQRYVRCAAGRTNPLYPAEPCAPTLDDVRFESVSLTLAQPDRRGADGIWVVNEWEMVAPFAQTDPGPVEAQGRQRLEDFLTARVAGGNSGGYVQVEGGGEVPLLRATTSGAPYERYEIDISDGPLWPTGWTVFSARLFADGGSTVVEQHFSWSVNSGMWLDANATTENGRPVTLSYTSADGEVTVSAPGPWRMWWPGVAAGETVPDVWFGLMTRETEPAYESGKSIGFVDPVAYDAWCAANGGSPLLSAPADAAEIAQQIAADPNFETTAPVPARIGGLDAVSIDVALAPGGRTCGVDMIEISRWIHELQPGNRVRLYLVDLPEGMSVKTLAITVVAPEDAFAGFVAQTAPIIESIEFHQR